MASYSGIGQLQAIDFSDLRRGIPDYDKLRFPDGARVPQGTPLFIVIYSSRCGHCIDAEKPFKQAAAQTRNHKVLVCTIRSDDPHESSLAAALQGILQANGIPYSGVPTYLMYSQGQYKEVNPERSAAGYLQVIRNMGG